MRKEIPLWVMENEPVKKPLVELVLTSPVDYTINPDTYDSYWNALGVSYEPEELVNEYLKISNDIYELFQPLFPTSSNFPLYERVMAIGITFFTPSVYAEKVKRPWAAYYCTLEGIVQPLKPNKSLKKLFEDTIHEFGHAMDHLLNPLKFKERKFAMYEMIAIFVEEKLGIREDYRKDHEYDKAQKILHGLYNTTFKGMSFAEQWNFLSPIVDHKELLKNK